MRLRFIIAATAVSAAFLSGLCFAQERLAADPSGFARRELLRKWRTVERAVIEEEKKAKVNQKNFDALHYELQLDIDVEGEAIAGTMSLWAAVCESNPAEIVLDLFDDLAVSAVREAGSPTVFTHANDLVAVSLAGTYAIGDTILLEIDYAGRPTGENSYLGDRALIFGRHGPSAASRDQVIVYTISEPYYARAWWPCKDAPDDKATARLHVTVPDTLIVASNGSLESELELPGRRKAYVWRESYPIATYLVSLAISNYETFRHVYRYTDLDSMEVTYFVYPEHLDTAKVAFASTVPMLDHFSSVFGRYPFVEEKYGMAEIDWFFGAMEHQTCTSLGTVFLRRSRGQHLVIAHELAHQWWGDLVTPTAWADVWLNEGFATYSEALWVEHTEGAEAYRDTMAAKQLPEGFPGAVYDPDVLFGVTVYWKGSWVLHMLRRVMGDGAFFTALREYGSASRFGYKNATTADFQAVCEEHCLEDLSWFFDEWVYGEGQPRYAVYWAQSETGVQNDVFLTLRQLQSGRSFRMPLDIRFSLSGGGDTTVTVWNSGAVEAYEFTFARPVAAVAVDPEGWVLKTIEERELKPVTLDMFPNPFNRTMRVGFEVSAPGPVELDIFDLRGARVKRLDGEDRPPGYHEIEWNGDNDAGEVVASGVYFVRIRTGQGEVVKKAVFVK